MSDIIDDINYSGILNENCMLVSFDVINMFQSIDNNMALEAVSDILNNRSSNTHPIECIMEALELCLTCGDVA